MPQEVNEEHGGTLLHLREESMRALHASERVVGRSFHDARLTASLVIGLLLVGFLLVAQWRGNDTVTQSLEGQSDQDLAIIIQEITVENVSLRDEVMRLQARVLDAERDTASRTEVLNEATRELNALRLIAGLEVATGPGIIVEIGDPDRVLLPQDFVALIHELRTGGAEAIAVNGVRLDARSGFGGGNGRVSVEGRSFSKVYEVEAIGLPSDLEQALTLPGGIRTTLTTFPGVTVEIKVSDSVTVPAKEAPVLVYGEAIQ